MMQKLINILFWSVISAAFIGPGTVTTAASAGAQYKYALLWALTFSTIACLVLREASARITIVSGKNLGEAIREQFSKGYSGIAVMIVVVGAIILGCAAYQTGNILGGVAGAELATGISKEALTIFCGLLAGLLLWFGTTAFVAKVLGAVVALMGIAFMATAIVLGPSVVGVFKGSLLPSFPENSGLLIMGLIGTTVVPYNLFLGSGIASQTTSLKDMRFGLAVAIILGGIISMAVLVVGTAITDEFSFQALSDALKQNLGDWATVFFAFGLFAAGFSSAITAPLAAAITAKSLFAKNNPEKWQNSTARYRSVWLIVLAAGVIFGLTGIRPIPAIILVQAFNGILLPLIAVFLFIVVNNPKLMGKTGINRAFANALMAIVVFVSVLLGTANVLKALAAAFGFALPGEMVILVIAGLIAAGIFVPVNRTIMRRKFE
ncbi:MAG: NRAMP family divalent metal transporter [bacterium]